MRFKSRRIGSKKSRPIPNDGQIFSRWECFHVPTSVSRQPCYRARRPRADPRIGPGPAPPAKPDEELVNKVRDSIARGVQFLKKQQNPQGNWEGLVLNILADMEGGATALVTLALLNCGEKADDPGMKRALDYLAGLPAPRERHADVRTMLARCVDRFGAQPRSVDLRDATALLRELTVE